MLTFTLQFTSLSACRIRACDIDIPAMFSKMGPHVSRQSLGVDVLRWRVVSGRVVPVTSGPPSIVALPA